MLDDIQALLDDARAQIALAGTLHDKALTTPQARGPFKTRIKNILEAERSVLDYLAVELTNRHGTPRGLIYYPLSQDEPGFDDEMENKMPGVAANRPDIADAIKKHQPWQPNGEWLRELNQLTREQKHNRLSTQIVKQTYQSEIIEKATGATVSWYGMTFRPGVIDSHGGIIGFAGMQDRPTDLPDPFLVGQGPTGFLVFGVPLDPDTQLPYPTPELTMRRGPFDRWTFVTPHKPILLLLRDFQGQVERAISEISAVAGL